MGTTAATAGTAAAATPVSEVTTPPNTNTTLVLEIYWIYIYIDTCITVDKV